MSTSSIRRRSSSRKSQGGGLATPAPVPIPQNASGSESSSGNTPKSPYRASRQAEQREFRDLNHRLERYIHNQRNAESNVASMYREIEKAKNRGERELERCEQSFQEELAQTRTERDTERAKATSLDSSNEILRRNLDILNENYEVEKDQCAKAKKELDQTTTENRKLFTENQNLKTEHEASVRALRLSEEMKDGLIRDLEKRTSERDDAIQARVASETSKSAKNSDLQRLKDRLKADTKRHKAELEKYSKAHSEIEKNLRKEFSDQLNEILDDRQQQSIKEKEEMVTEMKAVADTQIGELRKKVEALTNENEIARDNETSAKVECANIRSANDGIAKEREALHFRIAKLEEILQNEKEKPRKELEHKMKMISRLKDAFIKKEEEFDSLMDVKIALSMEIKAYRQLLEQEENRLSMAHRPNKRRRAGSTAGRTSEGQPGAGTDDEEMNDVSEGTPSIKLAVDIKSGYLSVQNVSGSDVAMKDWEISNTSAKKPRKVCRIPDDLVLLKDDVLYVFASAEAALELGPESAHRLVWNAGAFDLSGDEKLCLIDDQKRVICQVGIVPENATPSKFGRLHHCIVM